MPATNSPTDDANLQKIDHFIIIMMENRSFDHMLGYRSLHGVDANVNGLRAGLVNFTKASPGQQGKPVHPARARDLLGSKNPGAIQGDPGHYPWQVRKQMAADPAYDPNEDERWPMDGFVENYQEVREKEDPRLVMSYHDEHDVPVYDWVADKFAICDRWFCSVPSWTMPNTFYMLRGQIEAYIKDGKFTAAETYYTQTGTGSLLTVFDETKTLNCPTVKVNGQDLRWRCYHTELSHVGLVHHGTVGALLPDDPHFVRMGDSHKKLLADLAEGEIPGVVFVEPNWVVLPPGNAKANDDHAPANVHLGQIFVNEILGAVRASKVWDTSLVLIWYDEHGGFYDHVSPEPTYEDPPLAWTGVRIPALLMSPWVPPKHVVKEQLEHTAIFRTIFSRFAPAALDDPRVCELRLAEARHLGCALTLPEADLRKEVDAPDIPASWHDETSFHGATAADVPDTLAWFAGLKKVT